MSGMFRGSNLFLQGFVRGVGGEPDDDHAESVDQRHHCANAGVVAAEKVDEGASEKKSGGSGEASDVVGDAAASGTDACGKKFRQIQRQPTEDQRSNEALCEEQGKEDGLHRFGE